MGSLLRKQTAAGTGFRVVQGNCNPKPETRNPKPNPKILRALNPKILEALNPKILKASSPEPQLALKTKS